MQKYDDVVQNLHGDVIVDAQVQVMLAGTNTPASVFLDAAALQPITDLRTDRLGRFEFYIPNGRYDIYVVVNGNRVAHDTDTLMYDPEDDERVTNGGGSGGGGGGQSANEVLIASTSSSELDKIDSLLGNMFTITLDADLVLPPVKNALPGERYAFNFIQDAVGSRKVTYNRKYRFQNNSIPAATTSPQSIDLLETDYIGAGYFLSRMFKGYSVTPLARIGTVRYETMLTGVAALQSGQTLYVTRNGQLSEATAPMLAAGTYTVAGAPELAAPPMLHTDNTIRVAWGKGILNIEAGDVLIHDLNFDGAADAVDQTISGVRYNGGCHTLRLQRVKITNCNNGMLAGIPTTENVMTTGYNIEYTDVVVDKCGTASGSEAGQSHNIYLNHLIRASFTRCRFTNAVNGHDFKTRAHFVLLDRCYHEGAMNARELDVPNGGVIHAVNTVFRKLPGAGQGNLIGIGQEGIEDRPQEYIFRNCVLDNSQGGNFSETWIIQVNSTIPVKFVDCVFIAGAPKTAMLTPFELYYTGGPIGPEGWDQTVRGVIPKIATFDSSSGNQFLPDANQPQPQTVSVDPTLTAFPATGSTATPSVRDDMSQAI